MENRTKIPRDGKKKRERGKYKKVKKLILEVKYKKKQDKEHRGRKETTK